jgi:hypothetical protein
MTTTLTLRQDSILRMFAIMDTVKYSGGDWDDDLAARVSAIPSQKMLPGITSEEYSTISDAYSCPRAASDMLAALHVEVDGLVPSSQSMLDREIQAEIDKLQSIIDALRKMKVFQSTLQDKYWGSGAFADLDELSDVKHDHIVSQFIDEHTGIHMSTDIVKISYTIDLRQ